MILDFRHEILKTTDNIQSVKPIKIEGKYNSFSDYTINDHTDGELIQIKSVIYDDNDNVFERVDDILVFYEQTTNLPKDKKLIASIMQKCIRKHIVDLGLDNSNVKTKN